MVVPFIDEFINKMIQMKVVDFFSKQESLIRMHRKLIAKTINGCNKKYNKSQTLWDFSHLFAFIVSKCVCHGFYNSRKKE